MVKQNGATALTEKPAQPPRITSVQPRIKKVKIDRKKEVLEWTLKTDIVQRIRKLPTDEPKTLIIDCSPDMAMDLLTFNDPGKNRYVDESRVLQYKTEANRNTFKFNGDTICISDTFKLIDGQHRLWAIVESGKTIKIIIVTGLDEEAMVFKDLGKNRTAVDVVKINGLAKGGSGLAYVIKAYLLFKENSRMSVSIGNREVPNHKVNKFCEKKDKINDVLRFMEFGIMANKKVKNFFSVSQWALIYYILYSLPFSNPDKDRKKVTEFMTKFVEGNDLGRLDPIKLLRDCFFTQFKDFARGKKRNKMSGGQLAFKTKFVFEAWNNFYNGQKGSELKPPNLDMPTVNKPQFR